MRLPWPLRGTPVAASLVAVVSLVAVALRVGAARADTPPLHGFAALSLSSDGSHVAALEYDANPGGGITPSRLVIRDTATGRAVRVALPCGDVAGCAPGAPAWSPDGTHVAFALRTPGGHARTVYQVDADGLNVTRLAAFDGTMITLRFSRSGRLAGLGIEAADKEVGATAAVLPGGAGRDTQSQRIVLIENGAARPVSPAGVFVYEYDWKPDGSGFVATAAATVDGDAAWWGARLYDLGMNGPGADGGTMRLLYAPPDASQQLAFPRVSPDGREVAFIAGLMSDFASVGGDALLLPLPVEGPRADGPGSGLPGPNGQGMAKTAADGPGAARNLTPGLKATVTSIAWSCAGDTILAGLATGVDMGVATLARDGTVPAMLWSGGQQLAASDGVLAQSCAANTTAAVREDFTHPPEIVVGPVGRWRALSHENDGQVAPLVAREVSWTSDGLAMAGWLLRPSGGDPAARLPLIVVPHGGPAWTTLPGFEAPGLLRALLDHGYALLLPNPRGSFGGGEAFVQANRRDFGGGDYRDIMAGIDAAAAASPLDLDRLGITGVSYGGFMTLWATTQSHRFKAAVARAGISDWTSYYRQTGIVGWLPPYFGATPEQDPSAYQRPSPLRLIAQSATPTLLAVGDGDIECPPPQSQAFAQALRGRGVATDLVIYPGEGHSISDPAHVADLTARTLAWFDAFLK